jgi:hypothetical protein
VPDYKFAEYLQAPNIYHVKQEVSDLKDEDFIKAVEEYKQKQLAKSAAVAAPESNQERERESIWKQPHIYLAFMCGVIVALLGIGIYWLAKRNKNG